VDVIKPSKLCTSRPYRGISGPETLRFGNSVFVVFQFTARRHWQLLRPQHGRFLASLMGTWFLCICVIEGMIRVC
jgi:hypothetical protein